MNQRRKILTTLGLGLTWAAVRGPSYAANKVYRVGVLFFNPQTRASKTLDRLKKSLQEFGYIEGQNVIFDVQSAEGDTNKLPGAASMIVAQKPDVIVGSTAPVIQVLGDATKTIPIVMNFVSDPIRWGFTTSLAHPGSNITGVTDMGPSVLGKRVELIRVIAPRTTHIGVLATNIAAQHESLDVVRAAAKATGLEMHAAQVAAAADLEKAFSSLAKQKVSAVLVLGGPPVNGLKKELAELAIRSRMFTISTTRDYVEAGGLLNYGVNPIHQWELSAGYVDKILKGAKPGDLPIQQPTKLELIINGKTAKALAITLSQELLLRADEVIE